MGMQTETDVIIVLLDVIIVLLYGNGVSAPVLVILVYNKTKIVTRTAPGVYGSVCTSTWRVACCVP